MREDPLTTSLIEALITKGSNSAMMPLESSNDPTFLAQIIAKKNAGVTVPASRKIREALKKIDTWDYDVITVEKFSNCRFLLFFDACKILNTDWSTLHMWLDLMEANYNRNVPYHNSTHAADVLQVFFDELTEMCCLIAAVCHDIDHPGKNNHFLNNSGALLSLLYNDASVLEQHHASLTFRLTLADESVNIFKGLPASSYSSARSMIVDLIMSTDMMRHIEHYSKFATIYKKSPEETSQKGAKLVEPTDMTSDDIIVLRRMVIKCADVANPTRPLKLCKQWTSRICEEYFQQADEEKAKNYPLVMEAFDRQSCSIPATQLAFITIFVNDMMREWDNFLGVPELIHHLNKNHSYWKELHDKGCKKIEEDKS
ncbi:unnamed protein product [Nesidiocoris tenuis]|uniref:PDEase domain-containing protein n=1 Tax=Nesidiocoris tenuis TaxID=355587 RepID=A0A6H5GJ95_9HEMI|nr:unnamed protein product [Nesidiocoris tenuis]